MKKQTLITRSGGNVFADLGFEDAEAHLLAMRTDLMIELEKTIARRGLTQAAAGKLLGVSQARVSDLIRRKAERFSLDMLVTFAARLGRPTRLSLGRAARRP